MSSRIRIIAVGLLAVGLTSGGPGSVRRFPSRPADRIEAFGVETLVSRGSSRSSQALAGERGVQEPLPAFLEAPGEGGRPFGPQWASTERLQVEDGADFLPFGAFLSRFARLEEPHLEERLHSGPFYFTQASRTPWALEGCRNEESPARSPAPGARHRRQGELPGDLGSSRRLRELPEPPAVADALAGRRQRGKGGSSRAAAGGARQLRAHPRSKPRAPCSSWQPLTSGSDRRPPALCRAGASSGRAALPDRPQLRRFHTWGLCELLLQRSQEQNFQDPSQGEGLALVALEILAAALPPQYGAEPIEDLQARAWAYVANSRRVQVRPERGGRGLYQLAFACLRRGTQEPMEKAVLLDLRSSLLRDQRRFPEALRCLRRALAIFRQLGERHRAGRSLVNMSTIHHFAGEPDREIPLLYQALDLIDPDREPRLLLVAWHNLIDALAEGGQFMEAQKLLVKARPLYQKFAQPWTRNPRKWIEGEDRAGPRPERERRDPLPGGARRIRCRGSGL